VKLLLDTNILIWASASSDRLSAEARAFIKDGENQIAFSVASLWEIVIKTGQGRSNFQIDAEELRRAMMSEGWLELPILAEHVMAVAALPPIHRDPFDRLLLAQAQTEGMLLLTSDDLLGSYPGLVKRI